MLRITQIATEQDAEAVRALVAEFLLWLDDRYPEHRKTLAAYFAAQGLQDQLARLLTLFAPPRHACLLAMLDGTPAGTVMFKPRSDDACEMNRMFVRPAARGHGVGRALVAELMEKARAAGYRQMILSAGIRHHEAVALYTAMGFTPDDTLPDTGAGDLEARMSRAL